MKNKTFAPNAKNITRQWHFFDADEKILGRFASEVAQILLGKNKAEYTPGADMGDKVVITNAAKIAVTGKKLSDKVYFRHTGFPGGVKKETLEELLERNPEEALKRAIHGMLPKNKLRKQRMGNLYIYKGTEHPHHGQIKEQEK
jgi:large subunit ribosomal protein L13